MIKVDVYKNLHKSEEGRPVYSIRSVKDRRVIGHSSQIFLTRVSFHVGQGGRKRVLKEKRKNVHAFVRGVISAEALEGNYEAATYNPYTTNGFFKIRDSNKNISMAAAATLDKDGLKVLGGV